MCRVFLSPKRNFSNSAIKKPSNESSPEGSVNQYQG